MSRPWDVRELTAGNVLRHDFPQHADTPDLPTPGKLYRLPHTPASINALFGDSPTWTCRLVRTLARLGFDVAEIGEESVVLSEVGKSRMTLALYHSGDFPLEVVRVTFGRESWTAREACRWLAKRAAR